MNEVNPSKVYCHHTIIQSTYYDLKLIPEGDFLKLVGNSEKDLKAQARISMCQLGAGLSGPHF